MISGTLFSYSYLCHKKVWYFYHGMRFESENSDVKIGKLLDTTTYSREDKHFMLENSVNIDFLKDNIVHEIKKSSAQKEMAIQQVKYYIYCLKKYGIEDCVGELLIPKEKKRESVFLDVDDSLKIEKQLALIEKIVSLESPPHVEAKIFCKKCAYFDFCQM